MKILITKSASSPYRVDFYNELGKYVELDVLYEYKIANDRDKSWSLKKAKNFREIFMKYIKITKKKIVAYNFMNYLKKDYDLIIVGEYSTITGMLITKYLNIKNIPYILNVDGGIIKSDNFLKYKLKKIFISKATWWLSPSKDSDKYLTYYGAENEIIYRYPFTSVKNEEVLERYVSREEKEIIKKKLDIKEEKIIIAVGSFIYRKGFDVLLNAFSNVDSNVGLYIIGGEKTEEYDEIIKKFGLKNVYFINFKVKSDLLDYYKSSDVFVLPTREDIWGLVINEAMSQGLPVITTNKCVAGLELIENDINGYIIPTEDSNILSEKINYILRNDQVQVRMAENNLKKIKSYTIETMSEHHINMFKSIIEKRKSK